MRGAVAFNAHIRHAGTLRRPRRLSANEIDDSESDFPPEADVSSWASACPECAGRRHGVPELDLIVRPGNNVVP